MSYQGNYAKNIPDWTPPDKNTIEPPQMNKCQGWQVEEKPPAQWFNWLHRGYYQSLKELDNAIKERETEIEETLWNSRDSSNYSGKSCNHPSLAGENANKLKFPANSLNYALMQQVERINANQDKIKDNQSLTKNNQLQLKEQKKQLSSNQLEIRENHDAIKERETEIEETLWNSRDSSDYSGKSCNHPSLAGENANKLKFPANSLNYTLMQQVERINNNQDEIRDNQIYLKQHKEQLSSTDRRIEANQNNLFDLRETLNLNQSETNSNRNHINNLIQQSTKNQNTLKNCQTEIEESLWSSNSNYEMSLKRCNDSMLAKKNVNQVKFPANPLNQTLIQQAERINQLEQELAIIKRQIGI